MEREAKRFDYTVLDKAVEDSQKIYVDEIIDDVANSAAIEVISDLSTGEYVVIDIRAEDECIEI